MKQDKAQAEFAVAPTYLTLRAVAVRFIFSQIYEETSKTDPQKSVNSRISQSPPL